MQERQYPTVEEQDWREKWGLTNLPGYTNPTPVAEVHEREPEIRPAQLDVFRPAQPEVLFPPPEKAAPAAQMPLPPAMLEPSTQPLLPVAPKPYASAPQYVPQQDTPTTQEKVAASQQFMTAPPPQTEYKMAEERAADLAAHLPDEQAPPGMTEDEMEHEEKERCLEAMQWAVERISDDEIQELRNTNRPAAATRLVLETATSLLGLLDPKWPSVKRFVMSSAFIDRMRVFDIDTVSVRQFRMLKKALSSPEFDEATVLSGLIMACAVWARCIGVYLSLDKFRGGPRIRPVALQPALEVEPDLSRLNEAQLANVEELTVRRAGVGQLTFHGVTDCRGLNLNDIVRLEVGEVLVYPDASHAVKPRPGDGLNKSATVTMFQCWPPNGGSQMQDERARRRYREKIQQMTERKNAEFIDYDPEQGIWTFRVQHF